MLACNKRVQRAAVFAASLVILVGFSGWCVEISTLSTPKDGFPGSFVTHVFEIGNDSLNPETYSLVFTAPTGWDVLGAPISIALQPGEEGSLFVTVTIPPNAVAADYELEMTATSQSNPLDRGTAVGSILVMPMSEIELLLPTGVSIVPGDSVTYEFVLVNRGNVQDSFILAASSSRGLAVTLSHTVADLAPQERLTFTVRLDVPVDAIPGRDTLTVIAKSTLFDSVESDAVVFTSVLPPSPDAIGGTEMEELPARIRLSIDKNVMTGVFDSQLTFSTSGQILGGYFSSFFSLLDPFGPSLATISSFSMLYRRDISTFAIGNVSQRLTDLVRLSCTGGSLKIEAEYYDLFVIGGGSNDETRFAGYLALGPDAANAGFGYLGIRDAISISESIWTATAHAEPLEDWTLTLEGSLGLNGPLTSRAVFFNTTINSSGYFFSGSAFSVGTHFPGQRADSAGIEVSQRLRLSDLSVSASLSHKWDNVIRDPLEPTRIKDDLGFNLTATPLEEGPTLASTIDFSWDRYADLTLKSDLTTLLAVSLTETSGIFPYELSGKVLEQKDHVLGSHVQTTTYSEGVGLAIDEFNLYFQMTQKQSIDLITDTALSSSSDISIRFRPETALHEASITFRNARDDYNLSGSFFIHFLDDLDIVFDGSISWDRHDANAIGFGWGIAFNTNVTIPLPFLVTKGRIEGRAFIDHDGDGHYGLNDKPAGTIVVGTAQVDVSTNAEGYFRFPPFYPGDYTVAPDQLPLNTAAGEPTPATVIAGETTWIEVPLIPITVVTGELFEDIDKDGMRDSDESGYVQVRVILLSHAGDILVDAYTDLSGEFTITDVLPGNYIVLIDSNSLPDRFEFTTAERMPIVVGMQAPSPVSFGGFIREREVIITFQPPTADFVYAPEEPVVGIPVTFDGTYSLDLDGDIVSYAWDFDEDGIVDSYDLIATHTFQQPGTINVALIVIDDSGNDDTVIYSVVISGTQGPVSPTTSAQLPIASFHISPTAAGPGDVIVFNGTSSLDLNGLIEFFAWDFNSDGNTDSTAPIAEYAFGLAGVYDVTLTVTDDEGNTDSITMTIEVGSQPTTPVGAIPPIADFAYLPAEPEPGDLILFNATLSTDPDGQIVSYAWDFDGDGEADSFAAITDHRFADAGIYDVSLAVTDDSGSTDILILQVVVGSVEDAPPTTPSTQPPIANFEYSPTDPQTGSLVLFNGSLSTDSDGEIAAYAWDFNGDTIIDSTAAIAEYTFVTEGTFDASLTVTDDSGNMDTMTLRITVASQQASEQPAPSLPPLADFEYLPTEPVAGALVLFNGLLSTDPDGEITAYGWDFNGDGVIDSTDAFTEYVFPSSGTFDITLTVTDDSGNSDSFIQAILVDVSSASPISPPSSFQPPVADFSYMPTQPTAGELVLFDGTVSWDFDGEIVAYSWDFNNDGSSDANTAVAEHFFPSPGTITVSLTVTDDSGTSDTLSIPIEVE